MNLHYSQTYVSAVVDKERFYYLMNLHYSQTTFLARLICIFVLLPYEFTLLSNKVLTDPETLTVLLPYEFTLLSNSYGRFMVLSEVLLPYEFTLLSNYA